MLIDATHAEETRVAVVDNNRLTEYDYESKVRKQLKGSIFLAKVTRVEPSLQAAFVNFGGNRHGFLPFSEVHPDYYRIPVADREALIAEQNAEIEARRRAEEEADREEDERQNAPAEEETAEEYEVVEVGGENEIAAEDEGTAGEEPAANDIPEETPPKAYATARSGRRVKYAPEDAAPQVEAALPSENVETAFAENAEDIAAGSGTQDNFNAGHDSHDHHEQPDHDPMLHDEDAHDDHDHGDDSHDDDSHNDHGHDDAGHDEQGHEGQDQGEAAQDENGGRRQGQGRNDRGRGRGRGRNDRGRSRMRGGRGRNDRDHVESIGGDNPEGEYVSRPSSRRHYKIQEVVKRGQIMLVQVSKEERGNKGAAVTTYLSLPGRYCVLMPNSPRGGGVSRKIASFQERRRMRELLSELEVPPGMSVIMRTAGVTRTKAEIKRDFDYLMRLWDEIRETTLQSSAPAPIHEEGNLVRRSIRDIYSAEIEEVLVSGDEGYKFARDFMKMMMPSHAKRVKQYKDDRNPLFNRFQIEKQINEMGEPSVTLKSGGYIVINPTEALVSIDVNSGRATKERHIEETAVKTNLEAAEEVARQLRLRDLGGLVVIDFIDMEDRRNNRRVEEKLKQALSTDRARIQIGRISSFGLLELSRQRLNPSLTEAQFEKCEHCHGVGVVRTTDSAAIFALRALEEEGARSKAGEVILSISATVALYILNNKRDMLNDIERRYGFRVIIQVDETEGTGAFKVEGVKGTAPVLRDGDSSEPTIISEDSDDDAGEEEETLSETTGEGEEGDSDRPNRRRGRRGGRRRRGGREFQNGQDGQDSGIGNVAADESEFSEDNDPPQPETNELPGEGQPRDHQNRNRGGRNRGGRGRYGRDRGRRERNPNGPVSDIAQAPQPEAGYDHAGVNYAEKIPVAAPSYTPPAEQPVQRGPVIDHEPARVSNDSAPAAAPREYERVNEEPSSKKKGWWNRLTDGN
jgi:ribonuclease E